MLLSSKLKFSYSYLFALTLLFSFTANAQSNNCTNIGNIITEEPFVLSINNATLNQCATVNTKTAKAFVNSLRTHNLEKTHPGTDTNNDAITTIAGFNSLPVQLNFGQNSSVLEFKIPQLGITEIFSGADRNKSLDMLQDYLKNNDVMSRIMKYQAKNSPFSPITGQGGLIPTTAATDFNTGFREGLQNS